MVGSVTSSFSFQVYPHVALPNYILDRVLRAPITLQDDWPETSVGILTLIRVRGCSVQPSSTRRSQGGISGLVCMYRTYFPTIR